jgi:hypothetical protein
MALKVHLQICVEYLDHCMVKTTRDLTPYDVIDP